MSAALSVADIADHLKVEDYQVSRQCGRSLPATKERGPGSVGQGGQWRVTRRNYLAWLGLPPEDMPARGEPLPRVRLLSDIAIEHGVSLPQLRKRWRKEVRVGRRWSRADVIIPPSALPRMSEIAVELRKQGYTADGRH